MSNPSSSVQEKVSKLESDSEKVRNILAGTSTQPHVEANVVINNPGDTVENKTKDVEKEVNKETDKKSKPVDDTDDLNYDPKKFASMKDYEAYKLRYRRLGMPSKHFRMTYENAIQKLNMNYSLSETASRQILTELDEAYRDLWQVRQQVIETWMIKAQQEDTYLSKFFMQKEQIKEMFDVKFVQQSPTGSINQLNSTRLDQIASVETAAQQFKLEQERERANEAKLQAEEAERSLLERKEERRQKLQVEFQEKMEQEMASFDVQHRLIVEGGVSKPPSPTPSVTSSCIAPLNDLFAKATNQREQRASTPYYCRYCSEKFASLQEIERHELSVHGKHEIHSPKLARRGALPKMANVDQQQDLSVIQALVSQLAGNQFDPKRYVSKSFTGSDSKENFQNYSIWRSNWSAAEKKLSQLNADNHEKYNYMLQVLDGEAAKLVCTPFVSNETYETMLKKLDNRYSNPTLYLREVTNSLNSLPRMKDERESLMRGINALEAGWNNLKSRNLSNEDLLTMYFLNLYEPKLSPKITQLWNTKRTKARDDTCPLGFKLTIDDFFSCCHDVEHMVLYSVEAAAAGKKEDQAPRKPVMFGAHATSMDQNLIYPGDGKSCPIPNCKQNMHKFLLKCPMLPKISSAALHNWCKEMSVTCKLCLACSHKTQDCPAFKDGHLQRCKKIIKEGTRVNQECSGLHCAFLHFDYNPKNKGKGKSSMTHQTSAALTPQPTPTFPPPQQPGFYAPPEMLSQNPPQQ